jgi:uncharacterized membrane protein
MGEFICGLFFFIVGLSLLIYNKSMVHRSMEYHRANSRTEEESMILFNRILCVLAGVITSAMGYLTMLSSR